MIIQQDKQTIAGILQVVHSKFEDLVPKVMDEDDPELQRPDEDELAEVSSHYRFISL